MTDLDLEFEHIYLEVRAERWQHVERFLFSYFCFREGFVTKHGKPDWESARERTSRSQQVNTIKHSELEPVVPCEVIVGEIKRYARDGLLTPTTLKRILDSLLHFVAITKPEKLALKQAGLMNNMPATWYQSENKNPYVRFESVGINLPSRRVSKNKTEKIK